MLRTHYSNQLVDKAPVTIAGYVYDIRDKGKIIFITVRDREGVVQVVAKQDAVSPEIFEKFKKLHKEMLVSIEGLSEASAIAKTGFEVKPSNVRVIVDSEYPLPLEVTGRIESNLDLRTDWKFLDMRDAKVMNVFKLESEIVGILEEFARKEGLHRLFFSRMVGEATEGGTEYFEVKYFTKKAYLAQSPQLHKESVLASGIDKVYDLGFCYRAEPHHTTRHLCEFMSFDVEMVAEELEDILSFEEKMMQYLFTKLNERHKHLLDFFGVTLHVPTKIPRISLEEANKILQGLNVPTEETDMTPEGEKALSAYCEEKYGTSFVFVTHFPFAKKPFYIMRDGEKRSKSFDMLYNGLELTSGGIREHRYEQRVENLQFKGLDPKVFESHLRFWKYGIPPHGGFAIGIERLTEKILKLDNIREATLLPRDPTRLSP